MQPMPIGSTTPIDPLQRAMRSARDATKWAWKHRRNAVPILAALLFAFLVFTSRSGIAEAPVASRVRVAGCGAPASLPASRHYRPQQGSGLEGVRGGNTGNLFSGEESRSFAESRLIFGGGSPPRADAGAKAAWKAFGSSRRCKQWSVVTTINALTPSVKRAAALAGDWCTVVVADRGTPKDYLQGASSAVARNLVLLSEADQEHLEATNAYVRATPWRHFSRKSIGYLFAIAHGAEVIFDFDDDNQLKPGATGEPKSPLPAEPRSGRLDEARRTGTNAFNPYPMMGASLEDTWPRGFPLASITDPKTFSVNRERGKAAFSKVAIFQSLADHDPDVDAIFRLTRRQSHFTFGAGAAPVAVPKNVFAPYNAQASIHKRPGFFAMLLPISVPGRVSDIWRSYIAQRLLWDVGMQIAFTAPTVTQQRGEHDSLRDMDAEQDLYAKTGELLRFLESWNATHIPTMAGRLERLYADLYAREYVQLADVTSAQRWIKELYRIGYAFPEPEVYRPRTVPSPPTGERAGARPAPANGDAKARVLVTGVTGTMGSHVARSLLKKEGAYEVSATVMKATLRRHQNAYPRLPPSPRSALRLPSPPPALCIFFK